MIKKISIQYEEGNHKYYVYIDGNISGKHYTLIGAITSLIRTVWEDK